MVFLAAESNNWQIEDLPQADCGHVHENISSFGKEKVNNWEFCKKKLCPSSVSVMVRRIFSSWALSATRFTTFFSLYYFSFFKKSRLFSLVKTDCVYMINKIIQGCLQIRTFSSRVQLDTKRLWQFILSCSIPHSFAALTHEIASWTLEEKFHINAQSCIILYILNEDKMADFAIQFHAKFLPKLPYSTNFNACLWLDRSVIGCHTALEPSAADHRKSCRWMWSH